jgi:hypothetical protein
MLHPRQPSVCKTVLVTAVNSAHVGPSGIDASPAAPQAWNSLILDGTIVYVALPSIAEALGFSAGGLRCRLATDCSSRRFELRRAMEAAIHESSRPESDLGCEGRTSGPRCRLRAAAAGD